MSSPNLQPPFLLSQHDFPRACELFEHVFKHPIGQKQWQWKYQDGPRLGHLHVGIQSEHGQLLAHAGASIFEGQFKDSHGQTQRLPMAQVCDVMVHESARQGVSHQGAYGQAIHALQNELARQYPGVYAYGFAGIRPYKLGLKMGLYKCHQDCRMGQLQVQQRFSQPKQSKVLQPLQRARKTISSLFNELLFNSGPSEKLETFNLQAQANPLKQTTNNAQARSEFLNRQRQFDEWASSWGITNAPKIKRSAAYLDWRFVQNPSASYQLWLYSQSGQTKAWFVTRQFSPGQLTVVDALMHPSLQQNALHAMYQPHLFSQDLGQDLSQDTCLASQTVQSVASWYIQTQESIKLEPIKACEVKVDNWHACSPPQFWPADTDVF